MNTPKWTDYHRTVLALYYRRLLYRTVNGVTHTRYLLASARAWVANRPIVFMRDDGCYWRDGEPVKPVKLPDENS